MGAQGAPASAEGDAWSSPSVSTMRGRTTRAQRSALSALGNARRRGVCNVCRARGRTRGGARCCGGPASRARALCARSDPGSQSSTSGYTTARALCVARPDASSDAVGRLSSMARRSTATGRRSYTTGACAPGGEGGRCWERAGGRGGGAMESIAWFSRHAAAAARCAPGRRRRQRGRVRRHLRAPRQQQRRPRVRHRRSVGPGGRAPPAAAPTLGLLGGALAAAWPPRSTVRPPPPPFPAAAPPPRRARAVSN